MSRWGGLYHREIKQLMLQHAFQFANTVIFRIGRRILRSRSALEKLGGVCDLSNAATNHQDFPQLFWVSRRTVWAGHC